MKTLLCTLGIGMVLLGSGCTTSALYKEPGSLHRPFADPHLRLFATEQGQVLVDYTEIYGRKQKTRRRAYWLDPIQVMGREVIVPAPEFVEVSELAALREIPVTAVAANSNAVPAGQGVRGVYRAGTFSIHEGGSVHGPYQLPIYESRRSSLQRVALTPLAVATDVAVGGTIVTMVTMGTAGALLVGGIPAAEAAVAAAALD